MVREVTATEAKARLLALLDEVENGEPVDITRHGRRVARIVPAMGGVALWGQGAGLVEILVPISPAIAATAAALQGGFPEDPFDRIIYATAIEHGWQLVTRDQRMLDYPADRQIAVW
jgi:prevent-host-death family protein